MFEGHQALIAGLAGSEVRVECEEARLRPEASEVDRLLADNALARRLIGWEPRVGLEEGLAETIEWPKSTD